MLGFCAMHLMGLLRCEPLIFSLVVDMTNKSRNDLDDHFNTNVLGVHHVTRAFIPLLQKGDLKKIVNV